MLMNLISIFLRVYLPSSSKIANLKLYLLMIKLCLTLFQEGQIVLRDFQLYGPISSGNCVVLISIDKSSLECLRKQR